MTIAVVPLELAANDLGSWNGRVKSLAIFVNFLCQPIARHMTNDQSLALGFVPIPLGFLVLLSGVWLHLLALVLIRTCVTSAASYGFSYLTSLAKVFLRTPMDRAGVFIYAYWVFPPGHFEWRFGCQLGLLSAMIAFAIVQALSRQPLSLYGKTVCALHARYYVNHE